MARITTWALVPLLLAACATVSRAPQTHDRLRISADELMATHASTLFDAIQQLRPEFLRARGVSSISSPGADVPRVFVDNVEMGDIQFLKTISVGDVAEVQRIPAEQATTRWGTGYIGGALMVLTHSGASRSRS